MPGSRRALDGLRRLSAGALRFRVTDGNAKLLVTTDGQFRRGGAVPVKPNTHQAPAFPAETPLMLVYVIATGEPVPREDLSAELRAHVGRELGPVARPREVVIVDELPKTRSGKIMRWLLLDVTAGREPGDSTSLVDAEAFTTLAEGFRSR